MAVVEYEEIFPGIVVRLRWMDLFGKRTPTGYELLVKGKSMGVFGTRKKALVVGRAYATFGGANA